jgi:peptide/nickel transport system substrate-binding protein
MAQRSNSWQGRNIVRWKNDEYDAAFRTADAELDPVKRAALFIRMNDLIVGSNHVIPLVMRPTVSGSVNNLRHVLSGWDQTMWMIQDWWRQT